MAGKTILLLCCDLANGYVSVALVCACGLHSDSKLLIISYHHLCTMWWLEYHFLYYYVVIEVRLAPVPHEYHCNASNDIGNNIFLYTTQVNNAQWLSSTVVIRHYSVLFTSEWLKRNIQVVSVRMVLICFLFSLCGIYYIIYSWFCESGVYYTTIAGRGGE